MGLGITATEPGYRAFFTTAATIASLAKTMAEGKLKLNTLPRLIIIDEIGYQSRSGKLDRSISGWAVGNLCA